MWDRGDGLLKYFHAGPAQSGRQEGKTAGKIPRCGTEMSHERERNENRAWK